MSTNAIQQFSVSEMQGMARAFVDSNMFGVKNIAEALSLLLIAQAEGSHPATAMQQYHVIQGKPALKADAMLARFQQAGGVVQWEEVSDKRVAALFSHPTASPKPVLIEWTDETVKQAQLGGNPMHKKYPRQMKRARVISEGVRTVYPAAISGFYSPEEVVDFEPNREPPAEVITPTVAIERTTGKAAAAEFAANLPPIGGERVIPPPTEPEAAALDAKINGHAEAAASESDAAPPATPAASVSKLKPDTLLTCGFDNKKPVKKKVTEMDDAELEKARTLACESLDNPKWEARAREAITLIEWEQATRMADAEAADLATEAAAKDA